MKIEIQMVNGKTFTINNKNLEEVKDILAYGPSNGFIEDSEGRLIILANVESICEKEE